MQDADNPEGYDFDDSISCVARGGRFEPYGGRFVSHLPYPNVEPLSGNRYRLVEPYVYEWEHEGERYRLTVPAGFENDLASVPRILWWYISPFDLGLAAVLHDWLYFHGGYLPAGSFERVEDGRWVEVGKPWSRRDADRLFGRIMREAHVSRPKRRRAYWAVRLFGGRAWGSGASPNE